MFRFFWDLYLYNHFPKWLPTFTSCCSLIAPCLLIPPLGWIYGIMSSIALWVIFDGLSERNILIQSSRSAQGFAWGLISIIVLEYSFYVKNEVDSIHSYIFYFLAILSAISMYQINKSKSKRAELSNRFFYLYNF